jgi:FkbM family methyltransferase
MKNKIITIYIIILLVIILLSFLIFIKNKEGFENQKTYSQLKQDLKVLEFYKYKKNGFFIEIGANNGIELSNTYLLEKDYNWKGICVEALPDKFQELIKNRTSININKAVYNKTGEILNFSSDNLGSGITELIDKYLDVKKKEQIKVETITLNDILDNNNAPTFIDYLSIDTEGSEYIILSAVNFNKYKFGIIHLEHNYVEPRRTDMKNLLLSKGYKYLGENAYDDEYVHSSLL